MKAIPDCHKPLLLVVLLVLCLFFAAPNVAFGLPPANETACLAAGGTWAPTAGGNFRCELPSQPPSPGPDGGPPPPPPLPVELSVTLQSPETAKAGQDVARMVTLRVTNSGERPAPRGFRIQLGLYGQDPPSLKYQVKSITSIYQVNAGQTVTYSNLGTVGIPIGARTGEYNFCAKLENNTMDCHHIHIDGSGRVQSSGPARE
jgi:hypothetical protein